MCTVTLVPRWRGVRMLCNRDEQRTRPPALPPRVHDLGERFALFPVDPQGGGTWVGVNDANVVAALLNAQRTTHRTLRGTPLSRGRVVTEVLQCETLAHAMAVARALDAGAFEPFRLVVVHDGRVAVATNDGASIGCTEQALDRPLLLTSSSLGDAVVGSARQRLFDRTVVRSRDGWAAGQTAFHHHQWPHRPEISVRMERRDALTVSRTTVDVTQDVRVMQYEAPVDAGAPRGRECWSLH